MSVFKLKTLGVAAALSFAAITSHAEIVALSPDLDPSPNGENYTFINDTVSVPSFDDWIQLTVTGPRTLDASISAVSNLGVSFTAFDLYAADQTTKLVEGDIGNLSARISFGGITGTTEAATYWINIAGLSQPVTTYDGNIALTPVPEAETYSMMLAGLGLMGIMLRRRRS